ncbi:hypothetical protein LIER_33797 [Lithospermum erythrorhizon]|uniref:Uncharacterized protein n=1 Tax=Lithospermum erythrorhizon TaxID=34254 RepID=A0AAV3RZY0_LITER
MVGDRCCTTTYILLLFMPFVLHGQMMETTSGVIRSGGSFVRRSSPIIIGQQTPTIQPVEEGKSSEKQEVGDQDYNFYRTHEDIPSPGIGH